jgi:hypothetical protein
MASITRQHVGKYTYLYESVSFRDELGRPRNKKTKIGKLDLKTGLPVYLPEYLERMAAQGTPVEVPQLPEKEPENDWNKVVEQTLDSVKSYGAFHLFHELAKENGLLELLREVFPDKCNEIFSLASFLVESNEPVMYCEDWASRTATLPIGTLSSQRISELLSEITVEQRNAFYQAWNQRNQEDGYIALDITSISSYSQLMKSCEWGYNRDHENLPQINLCMLFGEESMLPVYQTAYTGSLKDVTTLQTTLAEVTALNPDKELRIVMDKGFFSAKNIDRLLHADRPIHFLISVPFTSFFAKKQVESERKDIDCLANTILTGDGVIRGVHKIRSWGKRGDKLHTFVYFNPEKQMKERNDLFRFVTELYQEALLNPHHPKFAQDFQKYLIIRKSSSAPNGYTISIREDVIEKQLATCGWMVLVSDSLDDPQKAIDIYRHKDVVEKSFDRLKNALDLHRLRIHSDDRLDNKLFLGFIAQILISSIHLRMKHNRLYRKFSIHKLLRRLSSLLSASVNGRFFLRPLSRELKDIFSAFHIPLPVG